MWQQHKKKKKKSVKNFIYFLQKPYTRKNQPKHDIVNKEKRAKSYIWVRIEMTSSFQAHLKFSPCWSFLLLSFTFDPKTWKMIRRFTNIINNIKLCKNKPTMRYYNDATDDLLFFIFFFRSTVLMTRDGREKDFRLFSNQLLFSPL